VGFNVIIVSNTILFNKVSHGGMLYLYQKQSMGNVTIRHNVVMRNEALQGGACFVLSRLTATFINDNVFINSSAMLSGHTFGSVGVKMIFVRPFPDNVTLTSGDTFPPFSVAIRDSFGNIFKPVHESEIVVPVLRVESMDNESAVARGQINKQTQKLMFQWNDEALFDAAEFIGYPGDYSIVVEPAIYYAKPLFFVKGMFRVMDCQYPKVSYQSEGEPFPRCVKGIQWKMFINQKCDMFDIKCFVKRGAASRTESAKQSINANVIRGERARRAN
jgi:hypothetical protein